jgi:hypothetical protein
MIDDLIVVPLRITHRPGVSLTRILAEIGVSNLISALLVREIRKSGY